MNRAETILKTAENALGMPVSQAEPAALHRAVGAAVLLLFHGIPDGQGSV